MQRVQAFTGLTININQINPYQTLNPTLLTQTPPLMSQTQFVRTHLFAKFAKTFLL